MKNYFSISEQVCKCGCGKGKLDSEFLERLNLARQIANIPFIVTSAYRCEKHNKEVKGSPTSSHLLGLAADIKAEDSITKFLIIKALLDVGFNRLGIGKNFIHVDSDPNKIQNVLWMY